MHSFSGTSAFQFFFKNYFFSLLYQESMLTLLTTVSRRAIYVVYQGLITHACAIFCLHRRYTTTLLNLRPLLVGE